MTGILGKVKTLKFRDFPTHSGNSVFFVESGYDEKLNLSIMNHLMEIHRILDKKSYEFVYFPLIMQEARNAAIYNYPQLKRGDFSNSLSSDVLLQLLEEDEERTIIPPCILQYTTTKDGVDYVNAYPISIEEDADMLPLMENLLEQLHEDREWCSSIIEYEFESCFHRKEPLTADETFSSDVQAKMQEVYEKVKDLRLLGVSEWVLKQYLFPQKRLSSMVITENYDIILPYYNDLHIKMEPLVKAVFILFLRHEEGIVFKCLSDYRDELKEIYLDIRSKLERPGHLSEERINQSIDALTNPLSNSINEKCARVRAAFVSQFDESLAKYYYIDGNCGEAKRIILDRDLVEWR